MKNNVNTCKPQFYYIKMGFKGSKLYRYVSVMKILCFVEKIRNLLLLFFFFFFFFFFDAGLI